MRVETLGRGFRRRPRRLRRRGGGDDAHLDLVVTCDTSIAHLAGALARPVWVALKSDAEWRWMTERDQIRPGIRRCGSSASRRRGDWGDVFERWRTSSADMLGEPRHRHDCAPCSIGELIDKITILRIKAERIADAGKLGNVRRELELLEDIARDEGLVGAAIDRSPTGSPRSTPSLWDVEDTLRACEREGDFASRFVALARSVYVLNDERAALKRAANDLFGSALIEEKSYG